MKTLFTFYFSDSELSVFKSDYFCNFSYLNNTVEVQSINTGHWWILKKVEMPISNKVKVWHKYHKSHKYHVQCYVCKSETAFNKIADHDIIVLNRPYKKSTQVDALCM